MTGQTGRVVNRKQKPDRKPKNAAIPTQDKSERDKVLQRMKDQDDALTIEDAQAIWAELPECCRAKCTPETVLADIQDS